MEYSEELIAERSQQTKKWQQVHWPANNVSLHYGSIIEVLDAYYKLTKFNEAFKLDPMQGKIFALHEPLEKQEELRTLKQEIDEIKSKPKTYSIYGDLSEN